MEVRAGRKPWAQCPASQSRRPVLPHSLFLVGVGSAGQPRVPLLIPEAGLPPRGALEMPSGGVSILPSPSLGVTLPRGWAQPHRIIAWSNKPMPGLSKLPHRLLAESPPGRSPSSRLLGSPGGLCPPGGPRGPCYGRPRDLPWAHRRDARAQRGGALGSARCHRV